MDERLKRQICLGINRLAISELQDLINNGDFTFDEMIACNLEDEMANKLLAIINNTVSVAEESNFKEQILSKIGNRSLGLFDIVRLLENQEISENDLLSLVDAGALNENLYYSIIRNYSSPQIEPPFRDVSQLPPMEDGRTDLYFIGLAGSGKTTMLSGLLKYANQQGLLIPDTYSMDGSNYQNQLIQDLKSGILPLPTASGSYNYIALSIKDENKVSHPFNLVDVPGEVFRSISENPQVDNFLNYIHNYNKKILVFVLDSISHKNMYTSGRSRLDQSLVFPNMLQLFKRQGVLEKTDAIYLVVNKIDRLLSSSELDQNSVNIADEFINTEFRSLLENCIDARKESKNQYKIKVMPFSIGKIAFYQLIEDYSSTYSKNLFDHLICDSFVEGGNWFSKKV